MKIQILGTGCKKCKQLFENAEKAAKELGVSYQMEKIDQFEDIAAMGVMVTPALAIDGEVKSTGQLLTIDQIQKILKINDVSS